MILLIKILAFLCWLRKDKSGEYKLRSYLPKHELEAIVRTFYPAVIEFFESEEGKKAFKEWREKRELSAENSE